MKTAEEKARALLDETCVSGAAYNRLCRAITLALKVQDRDTRHACAKAVLECSEICETPTGGSAISPDDVHFACMNVKAV